MSHIEEGMNVCLISVEGRCRLDASSRPGGENQTTNSRYQHCSHEVLRKLRFFLQQVFLKEAVIDGHPTVERRIATGDRVCLRTLLRFHFHKILISRTVAAGRARFGVRVSFLPVRL